MQLVIHGADKQSWALPAGRPPPAMPAALDGALYPAYAAACGAPGHVNRLGFGAKPALLLVDVCEAYFSPSSPLALYTETQQQKATAISALVQAARGNDTRPAAGLSHAQPIFYAQTAYQQPAARDAGLLGIKSSTAHLFHVQGQHRLTEPPLGYPATHPARNDMILAKRYPSPFFGTNLATQLTALGVDTIIIAGFTTSGSVRAATLDAMQAGFRPIVVADAVGDMGSESHWANLMDLNAKYADVVTLDLAVEALRTGRRKSCRDFALT